MPAVGWTRNSGSNEADGSMKILLLADNWVGLRVTRHLRDLGEDVVGLYLHPDDRQNLGLEIAEASGLPPSRIRVAGAEWSKEQLLTVRDFAPDLVLVVFWSYLLPPEFLRIPTLGCVNFHLSYLPHNRGKKPNVWPILDGSPAGVSIHMIDEGIDSGPIVARREVEVEPTDTAETLYRRLLVEFVDLFEQTWPDIRDGQIDTIAQELGEGTFHLDSEMADYEVIELDRRYLASDLLNLLRARTFRPHPAAYFLHEGRRVYVRVNLEVANDEERVVEEGGSV